MKRSFVALAAVGMSVALTACGSDDGPTVAAPSSTSSSTSSQSSTSSSSSTTEPTTSSTSSSSSSSSTTSSSSSTAPADFTVGQCLKGRNYERVACTEPHDAEVTAVVPNKEYATDLVKRTALRNYTCINAAASYTGGPAYGSLFLGDGITPAGDPKSAERITCIVRLYKSDDSGAQMISTSSKDAVKKDGFDKYQFCTSTLPSGDKVTLTDCKGPHVAESTGGFVTGKFTDPYPGLAKHNAAMHAKCKPLAQKYLGATRADIVNSQNSSPASGWAQGIHITACFVETKGTKVTKTMKGIGSKPLSSVQ